MMEGSTKIAGKAEEKTEICLADFQKICPYEFFDMLLDESDKEKIRDGLAYEVFNADPKVDEKDFENFMQKLGLKWFKRISSTTYNEKWEATGVDEARNLLYPINTDGETDENESDDEVSDDEVVNDGNRTNAPLQTSEISVLIKALEKNRSYELQESKAKPFQYIIYSKKKHRAIYEILPCCPLCYTLLPDGWFGTYLKDYIPISLVAGHIGGKTTYMASLFGNRFQELMNAVKNVNSWEVKFGISYENAEENTRMPIQQKRIDAQEKLLGGGFPDETTTNGMLPPVFIKITNRNKNDTEHLYDEVLIGIFDCAGEFFKQMGRSRWGDDNVDFLKSMRAYMYFVEASQIPGVPPETFKRKKDVNKVEIQSIEQQAKLQSDSSKVIYANDTIYTTDKSQSVEEEAFDILQKIEKLITDWTKEEENCALEHIAYTIIKSDQLKRDELKDKLDMVPKIRIMLENPPENVNQFAPYVQEGAQNAVREFFEKVIVGNNCAVSFSDLENVKPDISYSWHCVSVACESVDDPQKCEFKPVRISEPLFACVYESIKKLGWKM